MSGAASPTESMTARLTAVEERLRAHAARVFSRGALTAPDPPTGERWEPGQVWAHVAEFIPYWMGQVAGIVEHDAGAPVPFGRTKSDPGRIAAIERDRRTDPSALWTRTEESITQLRGLLRGLGEEGWQARGRHPTLGVMDMRTLVDEFLVGHLEQHADQLDVLAAA